ncbi:MAG: hypothetical protein JKY36_04820 [Erythrobacter sp.]|nr:hypothetical protein [Erythrobacter sp.]
MTNYVTRAGIQTDPALAAFVEREVLGPLGHDANNFWEGFASLLGDGHSVHGLGNIAKCFSLK